MASCKILAVRVCFGVLAHSLPQAGRLSDYPPFSKPFSGLPRILDHPRVGDCAQQVRHLLANNRILVPVANPTLAANSDVRMVSNMLQLESNGYSLTLTNFLTPLSRIRHFYPQDGFVR